MSRSHQRKAIKPVNQLPKSVRHMAPILVFDMYRRYQAHVKRHGMSGPHPGSDEWIDLPAGTPARAYLDVYRQTMLLPDVRTAKDPKAANEVWDWIEKHEDAGTLPMCIPSLRRPVSEALLPEAFMQFREMGVDPKDVIDLRRRVVRQGELNDDGARGTCYYYEFKLGKDGISGLSLDAGNNLPEECIRGIEQMIQELWGPSTTWK